jgi:hypothetical protein
MASLVLLMLAGVLARAAYWVSPYNKRLGTLHLVHYRIVSPEGGIYTGMTTAKSPEYKWGPSHIASLRLSLESFFEPGTTIIILAHQPLSLISRKTQGWVPCRIQPFWVSHAKMVVY